MWTILHVLFLRMRQIVLRNAGQLRCKPLIQPDESCLRPVPHKLHWFAKLAQREGERRVATSAHLYNEIQGLGRDRWPSSGWHRWLSPLSLPHQSHPWPSAWEGGSGASGRSREQDRAGPWRWSSVSSSPSHRALLPPLAGVCKNLFCY